MKKAKSEVKQIEEEIPAIGYNTTEVLLRQVSKGLDGAFADLAISGNLLKDIGVDLQFYSGEVVEYDDIRYI